MVACGTQSEMLAANDETPSQPQQNALTSGSRGDLSWLQYHHLAVLARGWQARYEMAQLALQNTCTPAVVSMAQNVVNVAPGYQQQLLSLACAHGAVLDVRPSFKDQIHLGAVKNRSGSNFDEGYAEIEDEEFTDLVDEATRYSNGGDDVSILANNQIGAFQGFASMAQAVRAGLQ